MVIFTIIVVITSNLIRKITLNMLFSVPCCEVHQIFFFWLSMVMRSAITTLKLKEVSTVNGMFPELQTALSIFQKQVAIAGNGFPLTLFQDIDLFSTFVPLHNHSCGFVAWLQTVALSKFQWVRHTNPVQALNVARLHLAVLGGRVLCVNNCSCCDSKQRVQNLKEQFCWVGTDRGAAPAKGR